MKRGDLTNGLPPDEESGGGDYQPRPNGLDRATELALLDTALLGDMQAFSNIFEHYRPALYTLCCRRLNDDSLAEDVVQEAFLKAFEGLSSSDHRKPIWPWLATIASRLCIDLQRRRSFTHYSGDIGVFLDAEEDQAESAIDQVIASEDRAEFWKSLDVLPERQRRVLLLYAVEGLSGAEIASAEGISAAAVRRLLFRARRKMWASRQSGPLPAIVFPFTWLRWKLQQMHERVRPLLNFYGEGFSTACMQAVCLGTVAMIVVASIQPAASFESFPKRSDETVPSVTQSRPLLTASMQVASPNISLPTKAPVESQQSVADSGSLLDDVINPHQSATPEDTMLFSITTSPNYENDHTLLAMGPSSPRTWVLFISNDGGGSWKPRPSLLLDGSNMVLPPGFPQHRQIFTSGGPLGLQQSDDEGAVFRTVSPSYGSSLAISPSFGKEDSIAGRDSRILIGGYSSLLEYDADTGVTRPALLSIPPKGRRYTSIAFSPGYQSDSTVFVSDDEKDGSYRCRESVCDVIQLPTAGPLRLRFSPRFDRDGMAYAFTPWEPLVSHDGARTFEELRFPLEAQFPFMDGGYIRDVAIAWNAASSPAIFVSISEASELSRYPPGIYRSFDAGNSWNRTSIGIPGFGYGSIAAGGANKLIATPTGRLLATGVLSGIACSADLGQTWRSRCPPEL